MKKILLLILLFYVTSLCFSQTESDSTCYRPKIGLVLSGGGAKGIAHIGVLKILEQCGIKPDYITGTSMGSIIGGLYACGYSASELDSIVKNINWNAILSNNIPLSKVAPEEKNDYRHYLVEFDLTKKGPVLPRGMVYGQGISEELTYLTWHVCDINNFDDLPIPFRCVATDLISGQPYIFDSGNLATAMRASMAIPSAFSPVEYKNMLLVDGGVLDNLPVQTCKDMGADIIIAVNVGLNEVPKVEDFKSIADVLMGAAMIRSNTQTIKSLKNIDILIQPNLDGYNVASFSNSPEIIKIGEDAALKHIDELEELDQFEDEFNVAKDSSVTPKLTELYIEDIKVENLNHLNKSFILGKIGVQKGHSYSKKQIEDGLHFLMGTRYIKTIDYSISKGNTGYILTLKPVEAYPSKYNFSIHYNNTYKASAIFNITLRDYLFGGSSFKSSIDVSEYPQFSLELLDHMGMKQNYGALLNFHWEKNATPYIDTSGENIGSINQKNYEAQGGFFFSPNIRRIITTGFYFKGLITNSNSGILNLIVDDVGKIGNQSFGAMLIYNKNSLDEVFFPNKGMIFNVRCDYPLYTRTIFSGSDESYELLKDFIEIKHKNYFKVFARYKQHIELSNKWNFCYSASIGFATKSMSSTEYFMIGGLDEYARKTDIPLIGFSNKEISAQQYAMTGIDFRYSPINNLYLSLSSNVLRFKTNYNELSYAPSENFGTSDFIFSGGVKISYESFLGPLIFGYGRSSFYNSDRFYFSVGFPF